MLFRETVAVYCENHMEHILEPCCYGNDAIYETYVIMSEPG
jgi:hypothetical protein